MTFLKKVNLGNFLIATVTMLSPLTQAQTIIPVGFGSMSVTQPSRETAVLTGQLQSTGGQNPTVKIRWGDEDRGMAVTPSVAWDNEVTISTNQTAGTFSTTITIPNLEKVYYFRSIASNSGGTVVSRSVGVLLPSAPVGVANLQGRWAFDGGNANDSSGTGRHGIAKKLFSPSEVSSMKLWLDASSLSTSGSTWDDKSGNSNDAVKNGSPSIVLGAQNGKNIMRYSGTTGEFHSWAQMTDIRTVFWVLKKTGTNPNMLLLGDTSNYFFHPNGSNAMYHPSLSPVANVRGGTTKINGTSVNGTSTGIPTSMSVVSLKTSGNVTASNFANDRNIVQSGVNRVFGGDLGELLIFNTALSDADIGKIEGYLAHKWGLSGALASAHPYKLGTPLSASGTPNYITDTPFGSGKAIDLADGHVEVLTGESEDVFDGGAAFSVSAWVKGWPTESYAPFVSKGSKFNKPDEIPSLKLWLDATDLTTMDKGTSLGANGPPQNNGDSVKYWADKSGNGHHATTSNSPTYKTNSINGSPAIDTTSDWFTITDSATSFDTLDSMSFFVVWKWNGGDYWHAGIRKHNAGNGNGQSTGFSFDRMNIGAGQSSALWWGTGSGATRLTGSRTMDAYDPKIITVRYDGSSTNLKYYANGAYIKQSTSIVSSFSTNSHPLKIGNKFTWGEFLFYRDALSDANREKAEGYLAQKWGLSGFLPSGHEGLNTNGWAIGRASSSNEVSSILSGVGGASSGSSSTISPSTDNNWHHVVSTFDGGTRKLYLDGEELSSMDASGSITANAHALIFGATDMNTTAAAEDEIKNVAASNHSKIKLDEVRFYNAGLTASEVADIYNFGKGDLQKIGGFSTAPSVISGVPGTTFSTTITADFPNPLYSGFNLPSGLSINSATGEISGSPDVGGTHILTVTATGGTNQAPKKASATITYVAPSSAPKFGTPGAGNVLTSSALLLAEIEQSGAHSNTIDFVWDTSDKGTSNISDWNGSALAVGTGKEGFYGKQVSDLNISTTYYYRNRAVVAKNLLDLAPSSLKLWLDASDFTGGSNWPDKSGNSNDATRSGSPSVQNNAQNGLSVMRYTANGQFHHFTKMTDIRTVFWVLKRTGTDTEQRFLLGDHFRRQTYDFHSNGQKIYNGTHADTNIRNGTTRLNGAVINGTTTNFPSSMAVMSLKTNGNVIASSFSRDRTSNARVWKGDLGELLIFNSALSDSDISSIEGYLAHKWGLEGNLPSGHSYKSSAPSFIAWSDVQSFTTPTTISPPVLGAQSVANLDTTSADLEVVLSDNGNDATSITFFYGDNDGGTTPASWDSNVSFSNAMEATIRKSITSLTSGQTYYFRTLAKNSSSTNNGEDWANSSTAFTTVTSSVREETEAVRYSDLEGWWKLDGNLNDSSGNNRHGTPPIIQTSSLWLDAADTSSNSIQLGSGNVQTWKDKSGNGYDTSQSAGGSRPSPVANGLNGLQTLSFDGTADHLRSTSFSLSQPFSVYAVAKSTGTSGKGYLFDGVTDNNQRSLLAFHNGGKIQTWAGSWANTNLATPAGFVNISATFDSSNSRVVLNGNVVSGLNPSTRNLTNGITIGANYNANGDRFKGEMAEIIFFNKNHSVTEREEVEGYLAQKWGLTGELPTNHPHQSPSYFKSDSANGTGKSLDLSNGVSAIVPTGGTEDVFDGGSAFSTSMWVKGWPSAAGEAIIGKDHFDPGAFGSLKVWLDASNPDYLSKSGPTDPPSAGDSFTKWYDLSGNNHHASTGSGTPSWESSLINSNPGVKLDGSTLVLDNSAVAFDEWSELHVFAVLRIHANTTWKRVFGKTSSASSSANTAWSYSIRRGDFSPPTYFARVRNNSNADFNRESGNSRTTSLHDSPGGLFTMSWGGW
ncbi:putative Ig domain-containing protein [Opitutales bacterium]|nr:putative Ig domain-containing protein [Opitutales bacterium]